MDYKKKFSKKALHDFKLIDKAIKDNDQNAYSEILNSYKNSIYYTMKLTEKIKQLIDKLRVCLFK